jgi:hypothetical protein
MNEPSEEFRRQQIHEVLVREGKRRMELMSAIAVYADTSENRPGDEAALREQLDTIADKLQQVVDAAREAGGLVGSAT